MTYRVRVKTSNGDLWLSKNGRVCEWNSAEGAQSALLVASLQRVIDSHNSIVVGVTDKGWSKVKLEWVAEQRGVQS